MVILTVRRVHLQIDFFFLLEREPCHIPHFSPFLFSEHHTEIGMSLPVTQDHFYVLLGIFPIGKKIMGYSIILKIQISMKYPFLKH